MYWFRIKWTLTPMRILVCIKRVPDPETFQMPDAPTVSPDMIDWSDGNWQMNRYDEYALEAALRLKEASGASHIAAVTVGHDSDTEILRRAIGMGVDHGIHIRRTASDFASPFVIGGLIAAYARENAYDLILCGVQSEDLMQGMVGPIAAGLLNRPCLTSIKNMSYDLEYGQLLCRREVEGGCQQVVAADLPALVTIQSSTDTPRYPALSKLLRANQYDLEVVSETELVALEPRQKSSTLKRPEKTRQGLFLNGTDQYKARQLVKVLKARGLC